MLFPIRLVGYEEVKAEFRKLHDPAIDAKLKRFYIPDFTEWEKDESKFNQEFDKLLDTLKDETKLPV